MQPVQQGWLSHLYLVIRLNVQDGIEHLYVLFSELILILNINKKKEIKMVAEMTSKERVFAMLNRKKRLTGFL